MTTSDRATTGWMVWRTALLPLERQENLPFAGALMTTRLITVNAFEDDVYWPLERGFTMQSVAPWPDYEAQTFFAYEDLERLMDEVIRQGLIVNGVLGAVEMWGTVARVEHGYRSDFVFPSKILLPVEWWGWYGRGVDAAARELQDYGCEVDVISTESLPSCAWPYETLKA